MSDTNPLPELLFEKTVTSTNDVAIDVGREGAPHGWCVCAEEQTSGRGRRGHVWASPAGSLYLSCVLRPQVRMQEFTALPAVCAMGVMDALRGLGLEGRVGIKWPNDIVARAAGESESGAVSCGDATATDEDAAPAHGAAADDAPFEYKLAGILVEAKASSEGPFAVVGLGMNMHPLEVESTGAAASPLALEPISLDELMGEGAPEMPALAVALRDAMVARVDAWAERMASMPVGMGPMAPVLNEYFDMVPMLGHQVAVLGPNGNAIDTGTFGGLDIWGRAVVVTPAGEQTYPAEAVSLRQI